MMSYWSNPEEGLALSYGFRCGVIVHRMCLYRRHFEASLFGETAFDT